MQRPVASSLAVLGMAAGMILPSSYAAQAWSDRSDRAERTERSPSQSVDRADAAIAAFKADLRLTDGQAKNWSSLQTALHDIAADRAKRVADNQRDLQNGRSVSEGNAAAPPPSGDNATARDEERGNGRPEDIALLRRRADALAAQSDQLKKIANAGEPLYDSLDNHQRQQFVKFVRYFTQANEADDWRARR